MNAIKVNGREYTVTTQTAKNGELQYVLTGKRNAVYATMRNVKNPHLMFLVTPNLANKTIWLTDKNGTLEVL